MLELKLPELSEISDANKREYERVQKAADDLMKPLKPTRFENKWDHKRDRVENYFHFSKKKCKILTSKSVIFETVSALAVTHTKQVFNALMLLSGILEHVTNRLIRLMSIDKLDDFEEDHFVRVFEAFAVQTKVRNSKISKISKLRSFHVC